MAGARIRRVWDRLPEFARAQIGFTLAALVLAGLILRVPDSGLFALIGFLLVALMPTVVLLIGAIVVLLPIAIHELGHYVFGRWVGLRFVAAAVGPWGWRTESDRIVRFRPRPTVAGGYVAMVPPDEREVVGRYALFVAGGPVASLLYLGALLAVWKVSGTTFTLLPERSGGSGIVAILLGSAIMGAVLMLPGTLLPRRLKALGGTPSDRMRLLALRRGGDEARGMMATLSLNRMLLAGVPAGDLPLGLLEDAARAAREVPDQIAALQMRWAYEMDHDLAKTESLAAHLAELTGQLPKGTPKFWLDSLRLLQAEQAVYVRHDAEGIEAALEGIDEGLPAFRVSKATIAAAAAAIRRDAGLDVRIDLAEEVVAECALKTTQNLDFERRWLVRMRAGWPSDPAEPLERQQDAAREQGHQRE